MAGRRIGEELRSPRNLAAPGSSKVHSLNARTGGLFMAFHSLMMHLVADLRARLAPAPTVVELGNQTFKPRSADLKKVEALLLRRSLTFDQALLHDIAARAGDALGASTADFYRAIGFAAYRAIDVNSRYASLVMDLNRDIASYYGFSETFDLVTNNGTGEHVFNQATVFGNAHALCKVDGVMLHVLPFVNYLNHGFFSFNPILFHDLAAANGYEILRLSIAGNHGLEIGGGDHAALLSREELQERCAVDGSQRGSLLHLTRAAKWGKRGQRPLSVALRRVMTEGPNVSVVAALRRTNNAPFAFPIQGMYGGANIADPQLREMYAHGSAGE